MRARLAALPRGKLGVLLGLAVGICAPYFGLQAVAAQTVHTFPATWLDRAIGFEPAWAGLYASIALLVPLAPLLASERRELHRYARGLALLCGASFCVFAIFPVAGPRPPAPPDGGLYGFLVGVDAPTNSFPSLHAGLTVYSFLFGYAVLGGELSRRGRAGFALLGVLWGGAIFYATLAIKQHWALDLPAGALLAWIAHRRAWRGAAR